MFSNIALYEKVLLLFFFFQQFEMECWSVTSTVKLLIRSVPSLFLGKV